jgi:hypothetical protein
VIEHSAEVFQTRWVATDKKTRYLTIDKKTKDKPGVEMMPKRQTDTIIERDTRRTKNKAHGRIESHREEPRPHGTHKLYGARVTVSQGR